MDHQSHPISNSRAKREISAKIEDSVQIRHAVAKSAQHSLVIWEDLVYNGPTRDSILG